MPALVIHHDSLLIEGKGVVLRLDMERRTQSSMIVRFRHEKILLLAVRRILVGIDAILNLVGDAVLEVY